MTLRSLRSRASAITSMLAVMLMSIWLSAAGGSFANAQVPVLDSNVFGQVQQTMKTVANQLGQLQNILGTVNQLQQAIGQLGPSQISGLLGRLSSMFSEIKGAGGIGQMMSSLHGIKATLGSLENFGNLGRNGSFSSAFNTLQSAFGQASQGVGTVQSGITQALYMNKASGTQADVEAINAMRAINTRTAATSAMAIAIQGKDQVSKTSQDIQKISEQAKQSQDMRGDLAVNNAIMIKMLEQVIQSNAQLSAMLHLQSASAIGNDSYNSQSGGN
jgi:hypothetical protein